MWWTSINHGLLAQGDLIPDCLLPVFHEEPLSVGSEPAEQEVYRGNLIVVTHSCDLENRKAMFVALCPIHTLVEFAEVNPELKKGGAWESVRKGRVEGLHLLASPERPDDNHSALVVNFRHIVSLPTDYLSNHAARLGNRWRLSSLFLEHFSQSFARFFMRVGLPSAISPYR
ncbi:MAG: hypothetical protein SH850_25545 [Planctomycetaceae bacterium]|nr:hypothetical protein [Planctomycetaceae bacterium]